MVAEAEEIGGRRRDGSRASELVRVLVVEEEDGGGPPGRLGWSWGGRRPRASRVRGRGGGGAGEPERVWRGMEGDLARVRECEESNYKR